VCAVLLLAGGVAPAASEGRPQILISTDVSLGLFDTHGGKSLSPVVFDADHTPTSDADVDPQDIDDGLVLAMALNLDQARYLDLLGIVPTYGNATLAAEMLVAREIAQTLKGRDDLPLVPGATSPVSQVLHPSPTWFDGETVPVEGANGSFAAACSNGGVLLMAELIDAASEPVTLLAIGPLTDVACLLTTAPRAVTRNIEEIVAIASRLEGESLTINGKVVNDFNFRMDPVGGTLFLAAAADHHVPVRLMSFRLTGQTSQQCNVIAYDAATYPGRLPPTPESEFSFAWLLDAAKPRNAFWAGIFGTPEGPFDQYALAVALRPEFFDCRRGRAYVEQCPFPAWSADYPSDADGNPTEAPYGAPANPCLDHSPANGASLSEVPAQLIVSLDRSEDGPLVRGMSGVDGNLPTLDRPAVPVMACIDFTGAGARDAFEGFLKRWTW
jgi:inosine-uridine nucleoside N-ribohydrolase